jgi:L-threonylcarbamoyladenylate synthase
MNFEKDIKSCMESLAAGGIILYPTDTVWGLGCDATNHLAVQRLCELKKTSPSRGFIVLVASDRDLLQYVAAPDPLVFDLLDSLNSPTTIIYECGIGLAENLLADDGTLAIRVVKDEFCKHLIKRFGKPIVSTSANFSNKPTPVCFNDIETELINKVDYAVESFRDRSPAKPSSLLKWKTGSDPIVIRP